MRFTVIIPPQVDDNLDAIYRYIADHNHVAAKKFVRKLRAAMKSLARMPRRCSLAPENGLDDREIRHLIYGRYRIIFAIKDRRVFVIEIRHGARLPLAEIH